MIWNYFLSAVAVLITDQAYKQIMVNRFEEGECLSIAGFFSVTRITNCRKVFIKNTYTLVVIWVTAIAISVLLQSYFTMVSDPVFGFAAGIAFGGAGSNMADRLWRKGIIDYIDLDFLPVFNLADVAIAGGVIFSIFFYLEQVL